MLRLFTGNDNSFIIHFIILQRILAVWPGDVWIDYKRHVDNKRQIEWLYLQG